MKLTPKIQKAINRAAVLHHSQIRKGDGLPYIVHPVAVGFILANYTNDEDVVCAGFLHDVLEDVPRADYSEEKFVEDFGENVLEIVKGVSEDKDPEISKEEERATWRVRKEKYLIHLKNDSPEAMMVCAADKIHNLSALTLAFEKDGMAVFDNFNTTIEEKMWFYGQVVEIIKEKLGGEISQELEDVYQNLLSKI